MLELKEKLAALYLHLPVMADFMEDLIDNKIFRHDMAKTARQLITKIRNADRELNSRLSFESDEEFEEKRRERSVNQSYGQIHYRQYIKESLSDSGHRTKINKEVKVKTGKTDIQPIEASAETPKRKSGRPRKSKESSEVRNEDQSEER